MKKAKNIRLLIVEDEPALRDGLASLPWEEHGITLLTPARNGLEALEQVQAAAVDILLTDIRMPGLSGIELASQTRLLCPNAEIVFLTGYGEFEYAQKAISIHAFDYILKPSTPDQILSVIGKAKEKLIAQRNRDSNYAALQEKLNQMELQHTEEIPTEDDVIRIIKYIGEHYNEPITLTSLAKDFHFNSVYLSRLIKKKSGSTFTELLTTARMYHAACLLKQSALKNKEICEIIGMNDERYFGQVFQKTYGMSPQEYRKANRLMDQDPISLLLGKKNGD